jgi:hypothetical protein
MPNPNPKTDHLNKFEKGREKTGGKQKGYRSPSTILKKILYTKIDVQNKKSGKLEKKEYVELVMEGLVKRGLKGDPRIAELIMDRLEGKMPQTLNLAEMTDEQLKALAQGKIDE